MFYNSDLSERNHAVATTAITVAVLVVVLKSWCKDNTTFLLFVSDIAIFVLKRDVKLQLTN